MTRIFPTTSHLNYCGDDLNRSIVSRRASLLARCPLLYLPSHPMVHESNAAILSLVAPLPSHHYSSFPKEFSVAPKPWLFVLHTAYATHHGRP